MSAETAHDENAERAFLGALMNTPDPEVAERLLRACLPEQFYKPQHGEVWRAVAHLAAEGKPHDWLSVLSRLLELGSHVDGPYLAECSELAPVPAYASYYASIIVGHARTRRLNETAIRLHQALDEPDADIRDARVVALLEGFQADLAVGVGVDLRGSAQLLEWAEFLSRDFSAVDMITDPLLGAGEQVSLIGDGKSGKSLFSLEWAARMAAGQTFLNNPPGTRVRGMYVDQENPHPEIQRRLGALGLDQPGLLGDLSYFSFPPLRPLDTAEGAADLLRLVDRVQPQVLWLDTISRMVQGEENSADTWLAFYRLTVLPVKSRGIASVRLDHFGKDAARGGRGSSAKTQDVDHVWELSAQPGGLLRLRRTHTRTGIGASVVMMRRLGHPAEAGTTRHERIPWGPEQQSKWVVERDVCARLDEANLPLDASRTQIRDLLRKQGVRMGNDQIAEVMRFRRSLAGEEQLEL